MPDLSFRLVLIGKLLSNEPYQDIYASLKEAIEVEAKLSDLQLSRLFYHIVKGGDLRRTKSVISVPVPVNQCLNPQQLKQLQMKLWKALEKRNLSKWTGQLELKRW